MLLVMLQQRYFWRREFSLLINVPSRLWFLQCSPEFSQALYPSNIGKKHPYTLYAFYSFWNSNTMKCLYQWSPCSIWLIHSSPVSKKWKSRRRRALLARKTRSSHWRTSYPGIPPLETLRRQVGRVLGELIKRSRKHEVDLCADPPWWNVCLLHSPWPQGLVFSCWKCSGHNVDWGQLQAWLLIWWLWIGLFFLSAPLGEQSREFWPGRFHLFHQWI